MNVVFLSPHFPPNWYRFCLALQRAGARVLGLADTPYDGLRPELRDALTEYYRVSDMHHYDEMYRALGHFIHRHGRIERLDSLNEYWLQTEAQLRTDFNIPGIRQDAIAHIKRKSLMKARFIAAGIAVAAGAVVDTLAEARALIESIGYPIVAKPDIGVGAGATFKIHDDEELQEFFANKAPVDCIAEQCLSGQIITYDGLTDRDGRIVFSNSLVYDRGVMEAVQADDHIWYYTEREIPADLEALGARTADAFNVRERFFHFEFFRTPDRGLVAMEVNIRPPGGLTVDMFNFANDIDMYQQWANVVVNNRFTAQWSRPYHCAYVGRKNHKCYVHDHAAIMAQLGAQVVAAESMDPIFRNAIGDFGYLVRDPQLETIEQAVRLIHQTC